MFAIDSIAADAAKINICLFRGFKLTAKVRLSLRDTVKHSLYKALESPKHHSQPLRPNYNYSRSLLPIRLIDNHKNACNINSTTKFIARNPKKQETSQMNDVTRRRIESFDLVQQYTGKATTFKAAAYSQKAGKRAAIIAEVDDLMQLKRPSGYVIENVFADDLEALTSWRSAAHVENPPKKKVSPKP